MHLHLLANSHLDPVWLWDWREGLNEGITTCRTILALMDEFPELTYLRGETSIYAHISRHDPATFAKIREQIARGRWDVVGGTACQPDTNLPATEVLCRHFTVGLDYCARSLGVRPTVAWAADSFGHSGGWPEIYAAAGMTSFAFSRPFERDCPLPGPAFWWCGPGGRRVLCWRIPIGWYGADRGEVAARLDSYLAQAAAWGVNNVAVFFGLGNHGGGPTRRQLGEIFQWRERHRGVRVEFSTLHKFFAALREESANLPEFDRELNFTLRGCYASAARFKFAYRKTENLLLESERTSSVISAALDQPAPPLDEAWASLLFNTFHDILPGSAIERAYEDQHAWLGIARHHAQDARFTALNALAATLDTRVPAPVGDMPSAVPVLLWNPHPEPFAGCVEIEAGLDYRPITAYRGRPDALPVSVRDHRGRMLPFQPIATENHFTPELPWRKRVVVPVEIPPLGWKLLRLAWEEHASVPPRPRDAVTATGEHTIRNRALVVTARPGRRGVGLTLDGHPLFGRAGIQVGTFADPFGSWGDHDREGGGDDISELLATWSVKCTRVLERGPHRAALWVQLGAGQSRLDLTFFLECGARSVRVDARLLWNERGARLKLIMAGGDRAEFEVPGGAVRRGPCGEVPGGRWVRLTGGVRSWIFASDALYNFDTKAGALRATVVRSTRYASNASSHPASDPWRPHLDLGEHRFQFTLGAGDLNPWRLAAFLEQPVHAQLTHPHDGRRRSTGSLLRLPTTVRLLAIKPANGRPGWILRLQLTAPKPVAVRFVWLNQPLNLGRFSPGEIVSWRLEKIGDGWTAVRVNVGEEIQPGLADAPPFAPTETKPPRVPCDKPSSTNARSSAVF